MSTRSKAAGQTASGTTYYTTASGTTTTVPASGTATAAAPAGGRKPKDSKAPQQVTHVTVSNTYPQQVITTTYPAGSYPSQGAAGYPQNEYNQGASSSGAAAQSYAQQSGSAGFSPGNRSYDNASKADKRAHHNALERKRRDHIKDSFSVLRDSIPDLQGEKSSRAQILQKATEYIVEMKSKNRETAEEMERLKAENDELDAQNLQMDNAQ